MKQDTHTLVYDITDEDLGMTILDVLYKCMGASGRMIRSAKRRKDIRLNGNAVSVNAKVRRGDQVSLHLLVEPNIFEPEDIPVTVVYEDMDILAVNKQPFLVVHPTKGHPAGTLANGLARYFLDRQMDFKIRFINRLDRDTSGLMLVAKNGFAQQVVSEQMKQNTVDKIYYAVVEGVVKDDHGTIEAPIGLEKPEDMERKVLPDGQPSTTHFRVLERFENATLVRVQLETGRTHQIRVHFRHIGHRLIGDELYGGNHELINRQALHATEMALRTVRNDQLIQLHAPLPSDMQALIERLREGR